MTTLSEESSWQAPERAPEIGGACCRGTQRRRTGADVATAAADAVRRGDARVACARHARCAAALVGNVSAGKSAVLSALLTCAPDACIIDEPVTEWDESLRAMLIRCQFRVWSTSRDGCSRRVPNGSMNGGCRSGRRRNVRNGKAAVPLISMRVNTSASTRFKSRMEIVPGVQRSDRTRYRPREQPAAAPASRRRA